MKARKLISAVAAILAAGTILTGCDTAFGRSIQNMFAKSEIVYQASTKFLYSVDGGKTWSQTIQEIPVDTTYYLSIEMQAAQSEQTPEEKEIVATITIPSTDIVDCYMDDHPGASITGTKDSLTGSVSYNFNIVAGVNPEKFRVVFECKPLVEGRATVDVVYDDTISESWDASGTIKYVSSETQGDSQFQFNATYEGDEQ